MAAPTQISSRNRNAITGAVSGFALALLLIAVGLIKFVLLRRRGAALDGISSEDGRVLLFYVAGLVLAGAFVGALRPVLHSRRKTYSVFAVAGAIAMNVLSLSRGISSVDGLLIAVLSISGAILGLALAFVMRMIHWAKTAPP